jgi:starch phosphorylase
VNGAVWSRVKSIPAEELWRTHERRRQRLVELARRQVCEQRIRRGATPAEIDAAAEVLNPDTLTIGFARRFATYKRATLILRDMDRLRRILTNQERPVQLIFAGKAHPQDDAGKELIRRISEFSRDPVLGRHVVFLEDYDMAASRSMVQGADVWLNTPLRPNEASGTSGMKAAANAVLNMSVPDGWWDEVWNDPNNSKKMGWAIGNGEAYTDLDYQDQVEADSLYDLLERDVVPSFYERGVDRIPRKWVERMKACVDSLCHFVNSHRMVRDYVEGYYAKAHAQFRALEANDAARARELSASMERIRREWGTIRITGVEDGPVDTIPVASAMRVRAQVHLGRLSPRDVLVELYVGRVDMQGELVEGNSVAMEAVGHDAANNYNYVVETAVAQSGLHGFTVRVRPSHPDMSVAFIPGLICWAEQSRVLAAAAD